MADTTITLLRGAEEIQLLIHDNGDGTVTLSLPTGTTAGQPIGLALILTKAS